MKRIFSLLAAVVLLALTNLPAQAAPQRFGAFIVFDNPSYILMDGDFLDPAVQDFRRALKARPKAKLLVLRSSGGYVDVALEIAKMVRGRGLSTAVPSNMHCYSACVYPFFAGRDHVVTGKLGVHRVGEMNGQGSAGADAYFNMVRGDIERYVPKNVMKYLVSTPTTSMHVFSRSEIKSLGINRAGPGSVASKFAGM